MVLYLYLFDGKAILFNFLSANLTFLYYIHIQNINILHWHHINVYFSCILSITEIARLCPRTIQNRGGGGGGG